MGSNPTACSFFHKQELKRIPRTLHCRSLFLLRVNDTNKDYAILTAEEILPHNRGFEGRDERGRVLLQKRANRSQTILILTECRNCLFRFFERRVGRFLFDSRHFGESEEKQIATQGVGDKGTVR